MRVRIAERASSARATLGRLFCVQPHHDNATVASVAQESPSISAPSDRRTRAALDPLVSASGVIRHDEIPLLTRYGTSYGLLDSSIADYACVLVSDVYRLGDYADDSVWVSGPLKGVIGGMPVMEVVHLELLKMKWMR